MVARAAGALLVVATLAAAAPQASAAQSLAGVWVISVELDAGSGDATFVFEVDGNTITGSYSGTLGDQEVTGTIEGNRVQFGFSEGQVGDVTYEGTLDGDTMSGTCDYGLLGPGTFTGRKS